MLTACNIMLNLYLSILPTDLADIVGLNSRTLALKFIFDFCGYFFHLQSEHNDSYDSNIDESLVTY